MYKYFKELEHPNDFKVFLENNNICEKEHRIKNFILRSKNFILPNNLLSNFKELFERIDVLDMFINGTNEKQNIHIMK